MTESALSARLELSVRPQGPWKGGSGGNRTGEPWRGSDDGKRASSAIGVESQAVRPLEGGFGGKPHREALAGFRIYWWAWPVFSLCWAFFRSFSLLFSYLVFVRFFVLFLSIFGPILGAKIDEISSKNYVIFLTVFWRFFSLFSFDFWCNVVNEG